MSFWPARSRQHRLAAPWLAALSVCGALALVGCSSVATKQPSADTAVLNATGPADAKSQWSGRLALQIHANPMQQWFSNFQLSGQAEAGELRLETPFGTTIAEVQWDRQGARLFAREQEQRFPNLAALTQSLTGAALPLDALFAWLRGQDYPVADWTLDQSRLSQGKLSASRSHPAPTVQLDIVLEN